MRIRKLVIITTIAALLLAISAVSTITPESASAYEKNQATSQTSACGNEFMPINIGCQNTDSQIQGDENAAALTAQQTFPEVKLVQKEPKRSPTPQTCTECFTAFLTDDQIAYVLVFTSRANDIEELCTLLESETPEGQQQSLAELRLILQGDASPPPPPDIGLPLSESTIEQLIDCLERVFGLQTEEPIEP